MKPVMGIVGWAGELSDAVATAAEGLGRAAVDAGFRIVTGGMGGVMEAACRGARSSARHCDGDVIGILKGYDKDAGNPYLDVVIPSGIGVARNVLIVATADVVVGVGGGAGTLSELAMAWQLQRPVIALAPTGGWSGRLAGESLDPRTPGAIESASDPAAAVALATRRLARG